MIKTCERCHKSYEGSNRSKYCSECKKEVRKEQKRKHAKKKRYEQKKQKLKIIKVSPSERVQSESVMCQRIRAKLEHHGSYLDWLEGKHKLTREEVYHIARCESCQRLWAEKRSPRGLNLFHEQKDKPKDVYQAEAERTIRKEFEDLI